MAQADAINALVALLKADSDVAAIAGARVFGGELPKGETGHMPRPAVVLQPSGGTSLAGGSYMQHETQRIDVLSFAATPSTANALGRSVGHVLRTLRRQTVSGCLIHWVEPSGGISARRDRETRWPVAFQSFQIFHALEEVSS